MAKSKFQARGGARDTATRSSDQNSSGSAPNDAVAAAGGVPPSGSGIGDSNAAPSLSPANVPVTNGNGPAELQTITIQARRAQYMLVPRPVSGLTPFSADFVAEQLTSSPDIDVIKTVQPPRLFGLQSDDGPALSPLVLARMAPERADLLQTQAGPRLAVERDLPLTFLREPTPTEIEVRNPGVLVPHASGFSASFEVFGDNRPVPEAEVYVFGAVWPTQGVTDASGRVTLNIMGESPDTIRAIYVKPKLDYWSFWLDRPQLVPNTVIRVFVKPLGAYLRDFPGRQLLGWGQRAMGLDRLPQAYDGAGIKIAVIDSGAAPTHRNLHDVRRGASIVGTDRTAWTIDTIGHGSHCTGIIAGGPQGSGGGIRGFAPAAEVHICRIFPGGRFSDLVSALDYCMEQGIDIANMSLGGGDPSRIIEERIVRAKQMGVACIVAAGNSSGPVQFPAFSPHCLAVAAVGKWGEFPQESFHSQQALEGFESRDGYFPAKFSCFGPEIDVCAPGVAIVSSLPADGFGAWDGTSMAAPHVTGLAALVLAHHPDFRGAFQTRDARRVERLFQIIKDTSTPLQFGNPNRSGAGLPNAPRAVGLEAAVDGMPQSDPSLDALRRLLGLVGGGGRPSASNGPMTPQSVSPQSVSPMQGSGPFGGIARGPAQTAGTTINPWSMDLTPAQIRDLMRKAGLL